MSGPLELDPANVIARKRVQGNVLDKNLCFRPGPVFEKDENIGVFVCYTGVMVKVEVTPGFHLYFPQNAVRLEYPDGRPSDGRGIL